MHPTSDAIEAFAQRTRHRPDLQRVRPALQPADLRRRRSQAECTYLDMAMSLSQPHPE